MLIYIGADHRGFTAKEKVITYLTNKGYKVIDSSDGKYNPDDDFPIIAARVANSVLVNEQTCGILLCGSGQGMIMAANRIKGIRAGLGWSRKAAQSIRNDENSNILSLPAEIFDTDSKLFFNIIEDYLNTPFSNATRYIRRNKELDTL